MKETVGFVAAVLALVSLLPYIADTWRGRTRPHLFTWLVWTAMTAIAFAAQISGGGGPGAWATGTTAVLCVVITALAFGRGEKEITRSDWLSLCACVLAGLAWATTNEPVLAVVLVTVIDAVAFWPTLRKSWAKPREETLITHVLSMIKHGLSLMALGTVSITTAFYPAVVGLMNVVLVSLLVGRRRQVA